VGGCSGFSVFDSASVRNSITMFSKSKPLSDETVQFSVFSSLKGFTETRKVALKELISGLDNWLTYFSIADAALLLVQKIRSSSAKLADFTDSSQGLIPYDKYRGHDKQTIKNRICHAATQRDKTFKRELQGRDIDKYV